MGFINFLHKPKNELEKGGRKYPEIQCDEGEPTKECPDCKKEIPVSSIWGNHHCCPQCGHHFRMNSRQRINMIADHGTFKELFGDFKSKDFMGFPGYDKKLRMTHDSCGENEAVICGTAEIEGNPCAIFVMEPYYMMGSMGTAVGEKITRTFEYAAENMLPIIGFTVSGGARMQEGILSLMQMAKTSGSVKRHSEKGLLYITVLTDPTTGGVTASFAMEGDIILAEPGATVGFAGARVIEQTTRKKLPEGFQKSEFLLEHGFIDRIVPRSEQRYTIGKIFEYHSGNSCCEGGNRGESDEQ